MSTADMIERRWFADWSCTAAAQRDLVEGLRARGATHMRLSLRQVLQAVIIGEGWLIRPDDEGELPL